MEARLSCGRICTTGLMACAYRYVITVLDTLTKETRTLIIAATDAFDAFHKAKELLEHCVIVRITYA